MHDTVAADIWTSDSKVLGLEDLIRYLRDNTWTYNIIQPDQVIHVCVFCRPRYWMMFTVPNVQIMCAFSLEYLNILREWICLGSPAVLCLQVICPIRSDAYSQSYSYWTWLRTFWDVQETAVSYRISIIHMHIFGWLNQMFTSISSVPSELRDAVGHPTFDPTGQSKEVGEKLGKLLGLDPAGASAFTGKTTCFDHQIQGFPRNYHWIFSRSQATNLKKWKVHWAKMENNTSIFATRRFKHTQTMFGDRATQIGSRKVQRCPGDTGHPGHPPLPVTPSPCPLLPHALLAPKVCASGPTEKVAQL